jgi:hypothetical protein
MSKHGLIFLVGLLAFASVSMADSSPEASAQDTKKMVQNNFVETAQKGIKLSGYVDTGYSYNFNSANQSQVTGRFASDTAARGDFNLYAVKIALEKALTSENKAQAGFRTDVMIGEDCAYLANRNLPSQVNNNSQDSNYLFLEQAYVAIRAPVGNGWDFKVGKFVSTMGYEVIERPANMNITYGLLWQVMPLYYTGVLSSYRFDDYLEGKLGVVNGSNTDNNTTTGLGGDGCALLASLDVNAPGGNANWSNNFQWSTNSENDTGNTDLSGFAGSPIYPNLLPSELNTVPIGTMSDTSGSGYFFLYNSWGNWSPKFAKDKLLLAFNALLGTANAYDALSTTFWGVGTYAKYQFNDWFSLASRGEYLGASNLGAVVPLSNSFANNWAAPSWWEYTLTANFQMIDNLMLRAEYRMDWGNRSCGTTLSYPLYQQNPAQGAGQFNLDGPSYYAGAEVVYSF